MIFDVPFLTREAIRGAAYDFLSQYHPSDDVPIPIGEIVECKLGLKVALIDRLYVDFGYSAFLSTDLSTITADERQYIEFTQKCRFSFAHEMGHYLLHRAYYRDLPFHNISEYRDWLMRVDLRALKRFEWQADEFAGFLLVPGPHLLRVCKAVVGANEGFLREVREKGLANKQAEIWGLLARDVAEEFDVSPPVAEIRIEKEDIPSMVELYL